MAYKNIDNIIINTSCNLFMEKGYSNVSVNEICSACSITKPTLYYHFKSKEDILYEYFRSLINNSSDMITELKISDINSDKHNGKALVTEAFNILFSVFTSKGYDMTQAFVSGCVCDISKAIYFPDDISDTITEYISLGQNDGSILNVSSPKELYASLCHTFVGYIIFWCQHNGLTDEKNTLTNALLPLFN